jgi:hypothetical protein
MDKTESSVAQPHQALTVFKGRALTAFKFESMMGRARP